MQGDLLVLDSKLTLEISLFVEDNVTFLELFHHITVSESHE